MESSVCLLLLTSTALILAQGDSNAAVQEPTIAELESVSTSSTVGGNDLSAVRQISSELESVLPSTEDVTSTLPSVPTNSTTEQQLVNTTHSSVSLMSKYRELCSTEVDLLNAVYNWPDFIAVPPTLFSCNGLAQGYYADLENACKVFHYCNGDEDMISFLCPACTLFNQERQLCDYWYNVECRPF